VVAVTLAEIVVDQLAFLLGAPEDVLDPDQAVSQLQGALSGLAGLPEPELASVRRVAEDRLVGGPFPGGGQDALRELVLLLEEIEAA
jgi:hypothetical protein